MIFVDTGAWYALAVATDPDHSAAKRFVSENRQPFVTSDYVVDELLTLFVVRRRKSIGVQWLHEVLEAGSIGLIKVELPDLYAACEVYEQFADKAWSLTDCTSFVLMQRLQVDKAFSFDEHFRQFGTVEILPSR